MPSQRFEIEIPEATLADLRERLARTRLVPHDGAADWDAGTSPAYLRQLVDYWRSEYDWRAQEARINRFAHFRAAVGGTTLHFIHERGRGPSPLPPSQGRTQRGARDPLHGTAHRLGPASHA